MARTTKTIRRSAIRLLARRCAACLSLGILLAAPEAFAEPRFVEHLPGFLRAEGPRGLPWWQWVAIPILLVVAWVLGRIASTITRSVLARAVARTETKWDDAILARIRAPLTFAWTVLATWILLPWLQLDSRVVALAGKCLRTGLFLAFFWALLRTVDIAKEVLKQSEWSQAHPASKSLVPIGARVTKVLLFAIALIAVVSDLGYPAASLIAGLGVGGAALALASQKTIENLFGTFSIGVDEPFRQGDFVRVDDLVGTVETIGLRSTRIRTLDRTVVAIPNGRLADMRLETFAARDRIRLACTLGLVYETTAAQMREVLSGLERVLREHPKIWPENVVVRFKEFAACSLDVDVMAWFETADWAEFLAIRQEVLLRFMEVVEKAGSSFAFPTRTIHMVGQAA